MNPSIRRIEVRQRAVQPKEHRVSRLAQRFLEVPVAGVEEIALFWVKSDTGKLIPEAEISLWSENVFSDPILQNADFFGRDFVSAAHGGNKPSYVVEVRYRPGVTDNVGRSATEALRLISDFAKIEEVHVFSGAAFVLYGPITRGQAELVGEELLANSLIQELRVIPYAEFASSDRFANQSVPEVLLPESPTVKEINLDQSDRGLQEMSQANCWALTVSELRAIQEYFERAEVKAARAREGLPTGPTDVEIEILAQTWSEHCKHKIFNAGINYREPENADGKALFPALGSFRVKSLFKDMIRGATERVRERRNLNWLVSVFTDNAGIVRFDPKLDLCIKVETHNSPSALDPYGGALTGIVGVNRDILGCGMGARPIANTDVFCFAPPDWPAPGEEKELPPGLKHPRRILEGVHLGIEHGGNKSGIPTINGAIAFHRNFAGKPLVFCGTIGALPPRLASGAETKNKGQKPGHRVVVAGGRVGKDGIHGATFSSMELNESAPATAVQIGDPITQKRLADFLIEARDKELFSSVTDNGAGGVSSSVGEMATLTGGATIDVALAPVKYPGLAPFELVVSESQERMTFAVKPENLEEFFALAKRRGVEATNLGEFRSDGFFRIQYKGKTVALLSMDFLHDGLPPMELEAEWSFTPPEERPWAKLLSKPEIKVRDLNARHFFEDSMLKLLSSWNIRSKEDLVRRYDHEVQAATVIKPFVGASAEGPGDAGVLWLEPHGGSPYSGVAIACGLAPQLSAFDTYLSAQYAFDEALRNCVAVGADPDQVALTDNFCWPDPLPSNKNPDATYKLAQLVRACRGLHDLAMVYGAPFVSGKDSMKNDFIGGGRFGKDVKISVPPTVLVTAMAKVHDVRKTVTSDFKNAGDKIFLLGTNSRNLGGSELCNIFDLPSEAILNVPAPVNGEKNLALYRKVHAAINQGLLASCHDCSEGGMLIALAESAIGGSLGVRVDIEESEAEFAAFGGSPLELFYNETPGRFVVSVTPAQEAKFREHFAGEEIWALGEVTEAKILRICTVGLVILDIALGKAREAWKRGFL